VDRRAFLGTLTGGLLAASLPTRAQPKIPRIGVLWPNPPATFEDFRAGLTELGYVEGRNIALEYRWAQGNLDRLPQFAEELVKLKVDVIVTLGPAAAIAVKRATETVPIVVLAIGDPVASGLVSNLGRPGGNLTGTTRMLSEMSTKHVELLKQAVPPLSRLAVLWNPANSSHTPALKSAETAAHSLAIKVRAVEVRSPSDLDGAFDTIDRDGCDGLLFLADPVFFIHLRRMADLAAGRRLPAVSNFIEFVRLGGLMGYAPSLPEEFRRAASYVDRILKGAKPGDLPIQQPTKFELAINLRTAKMLGLTIPPSLLQRADQVIE
jgi:putative tryptophan/tyrosine transport system substrate-binding protein